MPPLHCIPQIRPAGNEILNLSPEISSVNILPLIFRALIYSWRAMERDAISPPLTSHLHSGVFLSPAARCKVRNNAMVHFCQGQHGSLTDRIELSHPSISYKCEMNYLNSSRNYFFW